MTRVTTDEARVTGDEARRGNEGRALVARHPSLPSAPPR
jgi:hypothetical protein